MRLIYYIQMENHTMQCNEINNVYQFKCVIQHTMQHSPIKVMTYHF